MKNFVFAIFVLVLLSGCERNQPTPTWVVDYLIYKKNPGNITYRVTYRLQNGSTKLVGPISSDRWESESLPDFREGEPVSLEVDVISGDVELVMEIYRGTAIRLRGTKPLGESNYLIETNL